MLNIYQSEFSKPVNFFGIPIAHATENSNWVRVFGLSKIEQPSHGKIGLSIGLEAMLFLINSKALQIESQKSIPTAWKNEGLNGYARTERLIKDTHAGLMVHIDQASVVWLNPLSSGIQQLTAGMKYEFEEGLLEVV